MFIIALKTWNGAFRFEVVFFSDNLLFAKPTGENGKMLPALVFCSYDSVSQRPDGKMHWCGVNEDYDAQLKKSAQLTFCFLIYLIEKEL